MKIGLINIEPKIFNTALMQISHYHKNQGDSVEWYDPLSPLLNQYDKLYCSSLFTFTDKSNVPARAVCGGTGFDLTTTLPFDCDLDYSIYPKCKTSYVWFTRGCKRKCPWCVVPEKEGDLHWVRRKQLNPNGRYITIMDNSLFANPMWEDVISWIGQMPVDIQGIDVRDITKEQCVALNSLRRWKNKQFKIAWDNPHKDLLPDLKLITKYIKPYKLMCYVLIGYYDEPEKDLHRISTLKSLKIDPYVMCIDRNKNRYQKKFQKWVNGFAYKNVKWEDFK